MKILLVRPKPHKDTIGLQSVMICEPLELEYLAAAVKGRHEVKIVDMILEKKPLHYFIKKYSPQVVGMTAYIAHVNVVREYARAVKTVNAGIKVIVGGVHAEVVPEDFLDANIDYIVSANGITVFVRLLEQIEEGRVQPEDKIPGTRGEPARAESVPEVFPDRASTLKYRHRYYYVFHNPCALLKTSYGCPFSCLFCFCRQITGGKYYTRPLENVIEELKQVREREVYIVDDNFLVNRDRVERFCDLLQLHGIKKRFLIYGRADFIAAHEDTIRRFADCGLRAVIVGLESADPEDLKRYNKNTTVEINERAVRILAKHRVDCYATLILGTGFEERDFNSLYLWLKKLKVRFINLQPFTPLPGTPLFSRYQNELIIPRERYEQWDLANLVVCPSKLSTRRYYYQILKLYFKITLSPGSAVQNLRYGLLSNLRLSAGVARIAFQYLLKMVKG